MSFFLGLLVALGVTAWGVHWYLLQPDRATRPTRRTVRRTQWIALETPPLVPLETAEQLMQSRPDPVPPLPAEARGAPDTPAQSVTPEEVASIVDTESPVVDDGLDDVGPVYEGDLEENGAVEEAPAGEPIGEEVIEPRPVIADEIVLSVEPESSAEAGEPTAEHRSTEKVAEPQREFSVGVVAPLSARGETVGRGDFVGHCVRCREKRSLVNPTRATTKRGKPGVRGECAVCGAAIFILSSEAQKH